MKEEIENYLLEECGFEKVKDDLYRKNFQRRVGEVIVNGEHKIQVEELEFCIEYIGEGYEGNSETDNHPLTQWKITINGEEHGEFLVHDAEEFKSIFTK